MLLLLSHCFYVAYHSVVGFLEVINGEVGAQYFNGRVVGFLCLMMGGAKNCFGVCHDEPQLQRYTLFTVDKVVEAFEVGEEFATVDREHSEPDGSFTGGVAEHASPNDVAVLGEAVEDTESAESQVVIHGDNSILEGVLIPPPRIPYFLCVEVGV